MVVAHETPVMTGDGIRTFAHDNDARSSLLDDKMRACMHVLWILHTGMYRI